MLSLRVPLEADEVGDQLGRDPVAVDHALAVVDLRVGDAARGGHDPHALADELVGVAVAGHDHHGDLALLRLLDERGDHVVGLEALDGDVAVPERLDERAQVRPLQLQEIGPARALRLVVGRELLAARQAGVPHHDGRHLAVIGEDLHEHRREAEDRVRRAPVRGRDRLGEREERAIGERVPVDQEQLARGVSVAGCHPPDTLCRTRRDSPRTPSIGCSFRDGFRDHRARAQDASARDGRHRGRSGPRRAAAAPEPTPEPSAPELPAAASTDAPPTDPRRPGRSRRRPAEATAARSRRTGRITAAAAADAPPPEAAAPAEATPPPPKPPPPAEATPPPPKPPRRRRSHRRRPAARGRRTAEARRRPSAAASRRRSRRAGRSHTAGRARRPPTPPSRRRPPKPPPPRADATPPRAAAPPRPPPPQPPPAADATLRRGRADLPPRRAAGGAAPRPPPAAAAAARPPQPAAAAPALRPASPPTAVLRGPSGAGRPRPSGTGGRSTRG